MSIGCEEKTSNQTTLLLAAGVLVNSGVNAQHFSLLIKACLDPAIVDIHKCTRNDRIDLNYNILNVCFCSVL